MQYICSLKAAKKHVSAKIFKENLHTSVKILQICMDLQDSVQRSLQNPADKILQICTDSQRSKTWEAQTVLSAHYVTSKIVVFVDYSRQSFLHCPFEKSEYLHYFCYIVQRWCHHFSQIETVRQSRSVMLII